MYRLRQRRTRKTSQLSWSSTDSMVFNPSNTSSTMSLHQRGSSSSTRNTGFPDSFDGHRNTTLPHPDAIIAPDATLTEDDIAVGRALIRHRMFAAAPHDDGKSSSSILPNDNHHGSDGDYCASPGAMDDASSSAVGRLALSSLRGADIGSGHGKDTDSLHSGGSLSPTHPPERHHSGGGEKKGHKRRRSLLARLTHR